MARALLIYNPAAGQWWRRPEPEAVRNALAMRGVDADLLVTRGQDHATELVRQHLTPDTDTVWVCGGDGTVAQAATALVDTEVALGILPTGTVNVIALECGVPADPFRAVEVLTATPTRRAFRTWAVGGRAVVLGVGVGFEARAIGYVDRRFKDWLGLLAVGGRGVREWARYDFPELRVSGLDDRGNPFSFPATQLLATSPPHYAGHKVVAPGADPEDRFLELVLFRGASRARMAAFWAGIELPGALHLRVRGVHRLRVSRFEVADVDGRAVEAHVNGDAVDATPLAVEPWGTVRFLACAP